LSLVKRIVALNKRIEKFADTYAHAQEALAQLEKQPNDPDANLLAGRFYCLLKNDWEKGIPMLALSGDATWKGLAVQDLANPGSPQQQVALADGWWDLAQESDGDEKEALLQRAGCWYAKALDRVPKGLTLTKIRKRLEAIGQVAPTSGSAKSREMEELLAGCLSDDVRAKHVRRSGGDTDRTGPERPQSSRDSARSHVGRTGESGKRVAVRRQQRLRRTADVARPAGAKPRNPHHQSLVPLPHT
jgi:hypothetical protein